MLGGKKYFILLVYAFLIVLLVNYTPVSASTDQTVYVELSQFKFNPGRIIVNKGDTIVFKLRSVDVTHGFYIDGYDVNVVVRPGDVVTVTLVADQVGKFKIRCSVTCGPLHPFMVGDFIVKGGGLNLPFILSIFSVFFIGIIPFLMSRRGLDEQI